MVIVHSIVHVSDATELYTWNGPNGKFNVACILPQLKKSEYMEKQWANSGDGTGHNAFASGVSAPGQGSIQASWTVAGTLGVTSSSCSLPHTQVPRTWVDRHTQVRAFWDPQLLYLRFIPSTISLDLLSSKIHLSHSLSSEIRVYLTNDLYI